AAVMLGEGNHQVDGATGAWVAQVVQGAGIDGVASGPETTTRAATGGVVAAAVFAARLGQILDGGNALGDVGGIFAWSEHGCALHTQLPPYLHFTHRRTGFGTLVMLECRKKREFRVSAPPLHRGVCKNSSRWA